MDKGQGENDKPRRYFRKILFLVPTIVIVVSLWWWNINRVPDISVSLPPKVSPNGLDSLVNAGKKIKATNILGGYDTDGKLKKFTMPERERALSQNRGALATAHEALGLPLQVPMPAPTLSHIRAIARLFVFAGDIAQDKSNLREAAEDYLDAIQLGVSLPKNGNLIAKMTGRACESLGTKPLVKLIDKLTAEDLRYVVARLETLENQRVSFASTILWEKQSSAKEWMDLFQKYNLLQIANIYATQSAAFETLGRLMFGTSDKPDLLSNLSRQVWYTSIFLTTSKSAILADQRQMMDRTVAWAQKPYNRRLPQPPHPRFFLNDVLFPVFAQERYSETFESTHLRLLIVSAALRAYYLENHAYPTQLSVLVNSRYLKAVPDDPFAPAIGISLTYHPVDQNHFGLYSVGPDGKDDGGATIPEHFKNGPVRVRENSIGDVFLTDSVH